MRMRNRSLKGPARWLPLAAIAGVLGGCPNQELAPLEPCTVAGVSLEVPQSGVDKVDLLFMIDNSGSMAEEQRKLSVVLPNLVKVLTTGQRDPANPKEKPDFPPVKSLHIGVVSSDMGINGALGSNGQPGADSCGEQSFVPEERDPSAGSQRLVKPLGDDGVMNISTAVAVTGIYARPFGAPRTEPVREVVPPDPTCAALGLSPSRRFIDFTANTDPAINSMAADAAARQFACIAKLGKNGCGLEQQLESMLKALTPNTSMTMFSGYAGNGQFAPQPSRGHGGVPSAAGSPANANFLRPDAILAVVLVTDEEDCSIPDASNELFNFRSTRYTEDINVRCGFHPEATHPVARYVSGLRALKDAGFQDRIIFAGIVGVPQKAPNELNKVYTGTAEIGALLQNPAMQFQARLIQGTTNQFEAVPACQSATDGKADPARRIVELAAEFGENGVINSICDDDYTATLDVIIEKIAAQLTGACLPRTLRRNAAGEVECDVVEIKSDLSDCDPRKGHIERLPNRVVNGTPRTVCRIQQVAIQNNQAPPPGNTGWFYDDFSDEVNDSCRNEPQRISFTDDANPSQGSQVRFECFQPVAGANDQAIGRDAVGSTCEGGANDLECANKSSADTMMFCINKQCQIGCATDANCPDGWVCTMIPANQPPMTGNQPPMPAGFCINPTCPPSQSN